jgi:hypothetical protein
MAIAGAEDRTSAGSRHFHGSRSAALSAGGEGARQSAHGPRHAETLLAHLATEGSEARLIREARRN